MAALRSRTTGRVNPLTKAWIGWLARCSVPDHDIAVVLGIPADELARFRARTDQWVTAAEADRAIELHAAGVSVRQIARELGRHPSAVYTLLARGGSAERVPTCRPRGPGARTYRIRADGPKVTRLAALGYPIEKIAVILDIDQVVLIKFLGRPVPVRRPPVPAVPKPRKRRKRRRPTSKPPAKDAWRYRHDVGPTGVVELPAIAAAAELVDHQADAEAPPAEPSPRNPWVGPTSWKPRGEQHGSAKLTEPDVREILRRHANGESAYSLAKSYHVVAGTVRAIVRGETWTHIERPPSPARGTERSH